MDLVGWERIDGDLGTQSRDLGSWNTIRGKYLVSLWSGINRCGSAKTTCL